MPLLLTSPNMWMRRVSIRSFPTRVKAATRATTGTSSRLFHARPWPIGNETRDASDSHVSIALFAAAAAVALFGGTTSVTFAEERSASRKGMAKFPKANCLPHRDAVVLANKDGRIIVLAGAVNHSGESSEFMASLVQQVKPQAVFIDMNERVFEDFGIRNRVEGIMKSTPKDDGSLWKNLMLLPQVEGELTEIPDGSKSSMFSSLDPPVHKSIQAIFGQLRLAGVKSGDKVESWTHIVRTLQEGIIIDASIVLGGRDHEIGVQRGDEAMRKSNRKAAADLVYLIRPHWKDDLPARSNFLAVRQLLRDKLPVFEQVVLQELDVHTSRKLHQLDQYPCIVVVVMMIHLDGVEQELKRLGWVEL